MTAFTYQFAFEGVASFPVWTIPSKPRGSRSRKYMTMISSVSTRLFLTSGSSQLFVSCRWAGAGDSGSVRTLSSMRWLHLRWHDPRPDVEARVLVDHRPAPLLAPGKPILAPCAIIPAWSPEESRDANRHLASELTNRGFAFRVEVEIARGSIGIGLMFDGIARIFRNKPFRVWRLYYAIDQVIRQRRASGEALRIVVSHIVSQFLLRRCFLSALNEVWGHIESTLGRIGVMPPCVVAEFRCCAGLILICRHRADRPVSSTDGCEHTGTCSWRGVRTTRNWSAPAAGGSVGIFPPSHPNR